MEKLLFLAKSRLNASTSETVIDGSHIDIDGYTYERVSKTPRGKRILRKLINEDLQQRLVIYY